MHARRHTWRPRALAGLRRSRIATEPWDVSWSRWSAHARSASLDARPDPPTDRRTRWPVTGDSAPASVEDCRWMFACRFPHPRAMGVTLALAMSLAAPGAAGAYTVAVEPPD